MTPSNSKKSDSGKTKKTSRQRGGVDQRVVRAMGHPVRVQALVILNERVASPNEIAKELDQTVGHVSYHIKVVEKHPLFIAFSFHMPRIFFYSFIHFLIN